MVKVTLIDLNDCQAGNCLPMKFSLSCPDCKKASTKPGTTTITFERGCLTMVVKCVPAQVCPNCEEAYISEAVAAELLKDAEERANTGAQVEILQYVAA